MKTLFRRIAGAACACVTLLGGIPFTPVLQEYALQAEASDTIVDRVLITGVPFPYIGEHPVTTGFEVDEPDQVKVVSAYWYDETANKRMSSSDVFVADHDYFVSVYLEPKTGYAFPMENLDDLWVWFGRRSDESYASEVLRVGGSDIQVAARKSMTSRERPVETITSLLITGVPFPYIGEHPVTTGFEVDKSDQVEVGRAYWYDETADRRMSSSDVFEKDHSYYVCVYLKPKSGYAFPLKDLNSMSIWFGRRSDESYADAILRPSVSDTGIDVLNSMTSRERPVTNITSLLITGMQRPYAGEHPVKTGITIEESDEATIASVGWWNKTDGVWMDTSDVFENGKEYTLKVYIDPKTGYAFPIGNLDSMNIWFDRRSDESYADGIYRVDKKDKQICAENVYLCVEKPLTRIDSLLITGMQRPYAGEHPVKTGITIEESDEATIADLGWFNETDGEWMDTSDVFEAGKEYSLDVYIDPNTGYEFPMNNLDSMNIWFDRRSDESYADAIRGVANQDKQICAINTYLCVKKANADITSLCVLDLPHPYTGTHPTLTGVTTDEEDRVNVISVEWYEEGKEEKLAADYVFEEGKEYYSRVTLEPKDGYFFPMDDLESLYVWFGRRNDESFADEVVKVPQFSNRIYAYNSYTAYKKPTQKVDSVLILGVTYPYVGTKPTLTGIAAEESDQVTVKRVEWFDAETGQPLDSDYTFREDERYGVSVWLEPKEGYSFPMNDLDSMSIWFDRRSDESYADDIFKVSGSDTQIRVTNTYSSFKKANKTVEKIAISNIKAPVAGQHPVLSGFICENDAEVEIVKCNCWRAGQSGFMSTDDVFQAGEDYIFRFWFKAKDGYNLPEKPSDMSAFLKIGDEWLPATEPVNSSAADDGEYCCRIRLKAADYLLGDVDGNGQVNASDGQQALQAYANQMMDEDTGLTASQFAAADVDGDGKLTAMDAQIILTYFLLNDVLDEPTEWSELIH